MTPNFSVSEFVAVLNQSLEYAYPSVVISGELANFRVSKNKWVYFDLKDEFACVKFFGTVYQLPGPLDDGMMLSVRGAPRLHPSFGFSVNVASIQLAGEGTIKKAADLLAAKLKSEGLFDPSRKRLLPYPPATVGLITSRESAAYHDFVKILSERWGGLEVNLADVQVQGEASPAQVVSAIENFNQLAMPPEVLVITRGGGSAEDLAAFSDERVVRAVAASRIPTLVAIGHEIDSSLAELAADLRASTPSNAAEILVPDKKEVLKQLKSDFVKLNQEISRQFESSRSRNQRLLERLNQSANRQLEIAADGLNSRRQLLTALDPKLPLARGYALVRDEAGKIIRRGRDTSKNAILNIEVSDSVIKSKVEQIHARP